ncbi:protein of unknown function [Candidatus Filomicrobium marinum]|uniref:Uncharacterized protein n=1 Tax=Candidatus Filomicrobium marinum TaxID=1608628 RepID=A0A0D6JH52_9HYPH|nr:protein of unknown function [Candidatus Filomicrobium marinum]CPR20719.1 protein of unknown function [Candidatus Filomicrobium marinum]
MCFIGLKPAFKVLVPGLSLARKSRSGEAFEQDIYQAGCNRRVAQLYGCLRPPETWPSG